MAVTFKGSGIVWDKENNRLLCRFKNGEFSTNDREVATKIKEAGFSYEGNLTQTEAKATEKKPTKK